MTTRKQTNVYLSKETITMREELKKHFSSSSPVPARISNSDVIEMAIREMYEKYIGKEDEKR